MWFHALLLVAAAHFLPICRAGGQTELACSPLQNTSGLAQPAVVAGSWRTATAPRPAATNIDLRATNFEQDVINSSLNVVQVEKHNKLNYKYVLHNFKKCSYMN